MESSNFLVVVVLTFLSFASIYLITFITKFIKLKPTVRSTLIDLLYCDILHMTRLQMLVFVSAIVRCHLSESFQIDSIHATLVSKVTMFCFYNQMIYLVTSGSLRMASMLRLSEEAGIQRLGSDSVAIWKVRLFSSSTAALISLILARNKSTFQMMFDPGTLPGPETIYKLSQTINRVLVLLVLVLHVGITCIRNFQNREQIRDGPQIFIIFKSLPGIGGYANHDPVDDTPSFTAGAAVVVAVVFSSAFLIHSGSRWHQLFLLLPLLVAAGGVLFPGFLIASNPKMKKKFLEDLGLSSHPFKAVFCQNKVGDVRQRQFQL